MKWLLAIIVLAIIGYVLQPTSRSLAAIAAFALIYISSKFKVGYVHVAIAVAIAACIVAVPFLDDYALTTKLHPVASLSDWDWTYLGAYAAMVCVLIPLGFAVKMKPAAIQKTVNGLLKNHFGPMAAVATVALVASVGVYGRLAVDAFTPAYRIIRANI